MFSYAAHNRSPVKKVKPALRARKADDVADNLASANDPAPRLAWLLEQAKRPYLTVRRVDALVAPDQNEVRDEVMRNFIAPEHVDAILQVSKAKKFAVSFRAAGPATIHALQRGAAAKGHDILEKTIKASSVEKTYGIRAREKMAMIRCAGIEGYVGHWTPDRLTGIYLAPADRRPLAHGQKHEIYPIDMSTAEALDLSLAALKSRPQWCRLPYSGDYDMHDLLSFAGAGRPAVVPSQSLAEQKLIDALNQAVAAVDLGRPFDEVEGRVIRHGPQVSFPAYALNSPDDTERRMAFERGLVEAVARPGEFPVAFAHRGTWEIVSGAAELDAWYRREGAVIKSTWSTAADASGFRIAGDGFVRV